MATHRGVPFIDIDRPRDLLPFFLSPKMALHVRRCRSLSDSELTVSRQAPTTGQRHHHVLQRPASSAGCIELASDYVLPRRRPRTSSSTSCPARRPQLRTLYTPAEAFEALLLLQPSYANEELSCKVKPYQKSQASLPKAGASAPNVEDVLDEAGREVVNGFCESMMLSPQGWGEVPRTQVKTRPYMDSTLKSDPERYMDLVETIFRAGMLDFGCEFEDLVTPFFVEKKSGMLRPVWDCRCPNRRFKPPPRMRMASGAALADFELPQGATLYGAPATSATSSIGW